MKKHTKILSGVLAAAFLLAAPLAADARPFGHGYGPCDGPNGGWYQSIPQDKQDAVAKLMQDHWNKVQPLRDQLWAKSRTLDALSGNPNVQPKDITALVDEITALRGQLRDAHTAFSAKVKAETGVDLPFADCGMGGPGFRGHRGPGYGHDGYGHGGDRGHRGPGMGHYRDR